MTMERNIIFPLPLGAYYEDVPPGQELWLEAILRALNSLYGCGHSSDSSPTWMQKEVVKGILPFLGRMIQWNDLVPHEDFSTLFSTKGIDYRGEEVKLARAFNWQCIEGALPDGVGTLKLEEFCSGGCRHFVEEFERFLLPTAMQQLGRTPRVMVSEDDWFEVARGLIQKGICGILPQRELYHVGSEPLLNGMFAVSKNETLNGVELHRLIMNLVPLNRLCKSVKGDVGTLPTIAGFSAFYLAEGEVAVLSSEDIKCFYYLFQIPQSWRRFMGFARPVPDELLPVKWKGETCHLVSLVLPMGWAMAQHVHRNVLRWTLRKGLANEGELRRDKPGTRAKSMYRIYLDNWDEVQRVDRHLVEEVLGQPTPQQLAMRHQYERLDLPRHPKRRRWRLAFRPRSKELY